MNQLETDTQQEEQAPTDTHTRFEGAMAMLSPISRRVLELWLEGLSKPQIATAVCLREEEVSEIGLRAIQQVRDLLASANSDRNQDSSADS